MGSAVLSDMAFIMPGSGIASAITIGFCITSVCCLVQMYHSLCRLTCIFVTEQVSFPCVHLSISAALVGCMHGSEA